MCKIVKVGEKNRHMKIPDKWYQVPAEEQVRERDMVANIRKLFWEKVDTEDVGTRAEFVGDVVIREKV